MPSVLSRESTIVTAKIIALAGSGILTGGILSLSFFTTPILLLAPSPLAQKQWSYLYNLGKKTMPLLSLLTSVSYLVLSRLYTSSLITTHPIVPLTHRKPFLYLLSSGLTLSMVPYTMIFMRSTIAGLEKARQLLGEAARGEKGAEREEIENMKVMEGKNTKQLIDQWGMLNLGRAALTGLGFLVGIWGNVIPAREVMVEVVEAIKVR
ncbi:hypothetical protein EV426DRAFT_262274 [Tirmania nivea]|nr:hypothetical protein EV426DRAFT_262274 [Tirmania nivea]